MPNQLELNRKKPINFYRYYYLIDTYLMDNTDNTQLVLNDNMLYMKLLYDYDVFIFPVMTVKMSLSSELYKVIRDHDVRIRMSITKKMLANTEDDKNNTTIEEENFIENEVFEIIDKNKIMYNDNDLNEEVPSLEITFTLFSTTHLKANKKLFNGNFLDCRTIEILSFIQNINNSVVLVEKPSNMSKYEQIIIPPMNCIQLLQYLQDNYFIYKDGISSFFGYNEAIIMNDTITNKTPQSEGDYRNVILDVVTDDELNQISPYNVGYKSSNGMYYYVKTPDTNIKISDRTLIRQEILGSTRMLLSKDELLNTDMDEWEVDKDIKIIDKRKLYYDKYNNPYAIDFSDDKNIGCVMNFTNLDVDTFKPNKVFSTTINGKEYTLKVSKVGFLFSKDKENNIFISTGSCYFKEN